MQKKMKKLQADEILVSSKVSEQSKYDNIYNKYNMCLKKQRRRHIRQQHYVIRYNFLSLNMLKSKYNIQIGIVERNSTKLKYGNPIST